MGLFLRPRRPLMRLAAGAATAGIEAFEATQAPSPQPAYAPPPAPAPAAAPPPDSIAELERLARLHESGALTDEEFTAAKARALGL
jgi:Short C-terminal domain